MSTQPTDATPFAGPCLPATVSDLVVCGQCGTRYDSDQNAFCPRCGSTAKGKVLPAALQVARRNDPGRRRVQASGALLLIVGVLFLAFALVSFATPTQELTRNFVEPMSDRPGGELRIEPPADGSAFDVVVTTPAGLAIANATNQTGPVVVASPEHASLVVNVTHAGTTRSFHAIVIEGETLSVAADGPANGDVVVSPLLETTAEASRIVFLVLAVLLAGGGLCALMLRAWGLAAAAAIAGALLGAIALLGFLVSGLLFAVPFGFAAYFILGGRRHFAKKGE